MSAYGDPTRTLTRSGITYADLALVDDDALASLVEDLIGQASDIVDQYCGRDFANHVDTSERYDGTGRPRLRLKGWPILSVTSVEVGGAALTEGTEFEVVAGSGILERIDGAVWPAGLRNVSVVYSHGYVSPPGAIVSIVEDIVVGALTHAARNAAVKGASSMSMDGYSVAYSELSRLMGLVPEQMQILDRHRAAGAA